jgi:hypothetical protein
MTCHYDMSGIEYITARRTTFVTNAISRHHALDQIQVLLSENCALLSKIHWNGPTSMFILS